MKELVIVPLYCIIVSIILLAPLHAFPDNEIDDLKNILATKTEPADQMALFNKMGKLEYAQGKYANALENFSQALNLARTLNDSLYEAKMYSNIGVINDIIGNYSDAINFYQQSLKIYEHLNNTDGKESVLNNIGIVYEEMKVPDKALEYYFQALDLKIKRGDKKSIAGTYNNIAIIYEYFHEDSDSAFYYYNRALDIYKEIGGDKNEALIYSNLGVIHLRKDETAEAKLYFRKALAVYQESGDPRKIASSLHHLGLAYYNENNFQQALKYYLQSMELAEKSNVRKLLSQLYNDLSQLYEKQGNYSKALEYNKKYEEVKDDLLNLEKIKEIHQMEISFEVEKREQEIVLLTKQGELNELEITWVRTLTYALVVIFILAIVIIVLIYARNRYKKEQELVSLQTSLFRSQTSPHFIFNSLMSIQTFLLDNKVNIASEYLVDFAKLIRSILQHTRKSFITLDKEIEVLQQYVKLEKLRFSDKFDYEFIINVEDPEEITIPPMLAQPFIENAINHGLVPGQKKGFLKLVLEEKGNELTFLIEDNGIGRKKSLENSKGKTHQSLATDITSQRLQLMLKRYKRKISMKIEDLYDEDGISAGTRVLFSITID